MWNTCLTLLARPTRRACMRSISALTVGACLLLAAEAMGEPERMTKQTTAGSLIAVSKETAVDARVLRRPVSNGQANHQRT